MKVYELSNHLGNVMVTVSDKRLGVDLGGNGTADYYLADVTSATDYYPFGMQIPGRTFSPDDYRFGFNGMEKSQLEGGYTTLFRQYDSRIGRWFSTDPMMQSFPDQSPYNFVFNNPNILTDVNGDCPNGDCHDNIDEAMPTSTNPIPSTINTEPKSNNSIVSPDYQNFKQNISVSYNSSTDPKMNGSTTVKESIMNTTGKYQNGNWVETKTMTSTAVTYSNTGNEIGRSQMTQKVTRTFSVDKKGGNLYRGTEISKNESVPVLLNGDYNVVMSELHETFGNLTSKYLNSTGASPLLKYDDNIKAATDAYLIAVTTAGGGVGGVYTKAVMTILGLSTWSGIDYSPKHSIVGASATYYSATLIYHTNLPTNIPITHTLDKRALLK